MASHWFGGIKGITDYRMCVTVCLTMGHSIFLLFRKRGEIFVRQKKKQRMTIREQGENESKKETRKSGWLHSVYGSRSRDGEMLSSWSPPILFLWIESQSESKNIVKRAVKQLLTVRAVDWSTSLGLLSSCPMHSKQWWSGKRNSSQLEIRIQTVFTRTRKLSQQKSYSCRTQGSVKGWEVTLSDGWYFFLCAVFLVERGWDSFPHSHSCVGLSLLSDSRMSGRTINQEGNETREE